MSVNLSQQINDIVAFIATKLKTRPTVGMILGTGLGEFSHTICDPLIIPYHEIPHLPPATAPGHAGNLIVGYIGNKYVIAMQGRLHLYEGNTPQTATLLIRAMQKLGIKTLIISCAAGGLNKFFQGGDIMLVTDHINLTGMSPLTGPNLDEFGPRFPIMFDIYDKQLANLIRGIALENKIHLHSGTYIGYAGPHYCTRAELNYFTIIGGDAVGMSLVQEAIAAAHSGLKILALAAITDSAMPYVENHATEEEVLAAGKQISSKFGKLISKLIEAI